MDNDERFEIITSTTYDQDYDFDVNMCVTVLPILVALVGTATFGNLRIPHELVGMILGGTLGLFIKYIPVMEKVADQFWSPSHVITVLQPALILKMVYNIDTYLFVKCWSQVLVLSTLGFILYDIIFGTFLMLFSSRNVNLLNIVMAGSILAPIDVPDIILELESIKNLEVLMDGESVFGTAFCLMTFELCLKGYGTSYTTKNVYLDVFKFYLQYICLACIVGIPIGKLSSFVFRYLYNDPINSIMIIVGTSYTTFFLCENVMYCSGTIALFIAVFLISQERSRLSNEVDNDVLNFLTAVNYVTESISIVALSAYVVLRVAQLFGNFDVAVAICVYVIGNVVRLVVLLILSPVLSRLGYGFDFTSMLSIFWAAKKGPMQIITTISLSYHDVINEIGSEMLVITVVYLVLVFLINGTTLKAILRKFGLIDFSAARRNNLNNCFTSLNDKRSRLIGTMKMNRFFSDANWKLIHESTRLLNNFEDKTADDKSKTKPNEAYCDTCDKVIPVKPTKKDFIDMIKEGRMRILKAKRVSFVRQYENGILNKDGMRVLLQAVEIAMGSKELIIKLDDLFKTFKQAKFVEKFKVYLLKYKVEDNFKPPRNKCQKLCHRIHTHMAFEVFYFVTIGINCIVIIIITLTINFASNSNNIQLILLNIANLIFLFLYYMEFMIIFIAFSSNGSKAALKLYYRLRWHRFDLAMLCINSVDQILLLWCLVYPNDINVFYTVVALRLGRIAKFCKALEKLNPKLVTYCDKIIDVKASYVFTIGKALVIAYEEVIEILPKIAFNEKVRENIRFQIESDKMTVTKELGLLEKERPWIAITVKTKQAMTSTLTSMKNTIMQLKTAGFVDNYEFDRLHMSLEDCFKVVTNSKSIETMIPKSIFYEVPWISEEEVISDFLYENVTTKIWDAGDVICRQGEVAEGVFILVTGLFKLTYVPTDEFIEHLNLFGYLPVRDFIRNTQFKEIQEEYLMMGNSIGELSVLTGRPYSCTVVSDTPSQAFIIPSDVIHEALVKSKDPVNGLSCKIWKYIVWNMTKMILLDTPTYESATHEQLYFLLDRAFVPNLAYYKVFVLSDMVEDVVLVEGLIIDWNTREIYTAPCYIPRNVQKMLLPHTISCTHSDRIISTKLLIIPVKDVDEYDLMEKAENISELIRRTPSSSILENAPRSQRKLKKKERINKGSKPTGGMQYARSMILAKTRYVASSRSDDESGPFETSTHNLSDLELDEHELFMLGHNFFNMDTPSPQPALVARMSQIHQRLSQIPANVGGTPRLSQSPQSSTNQPGYSSRMSQPRVSQIPTLPMQMPQHGNSQVPHNNPKEQLRQSIQQHLLKEQFEQIQKRPTRTSHHPSK